MFISLSVNFTEDIDIDDMVLSITNANMQTDFSA